MKFKLVLENGREFIGENFGSISHQIGEIFFSTSMVGYQDLLSDPAYFGKIACLTYPLIGNYGLTDDDYDFKGIHIRGYVVKENNDSPSNFRSTRVFSEALEENNVTGLSDVDTREITKIIRDEGVMKAMITDIDMPLGECLKQLKEFKEENPLSKVSCKRIWYSRTANPTHTIVVFDLGVKTTLIKKFNLAFISFKIGVAIKLSVFPSLSPSKKSRRAVILISVISLIFLPPTRTASASFLSLFP